MATVSRSVQTATRVSWVDLVPQVDPKGQVLQASTASIRAQAQGNTLHVTDSSHSTRSKTKSSMLAMTAKPDEQSFSESGVRPVISYAAVACGGQSTTENIRAQEPDLSQRLLTVEEALRKEIELNRVLGIRAMTLEREVESSKNRVKKMRDEVGKSNQEKDQLRTQVQTTTDKHNHVSRINTELKGNLAELRDQSKGHQTRAEELKQAYDHTQVAKTNLQQQLTTAEAEVGRLRQEISSQVSLIPASSKTEEEYFRDILSLNQKVKDLANHLTRDEANRGLFIGSRKEQRISIQNWLYRILWYSIFNRMLGSVDDAQSAWLLGLYHGLPPVGK